MSSATSGSLPASFLELIRTSEKPVLVDFWAPWCGPCRMVGPVIQRIAREYRGRILTVKVNTDEKPDVASAYEIQSIPTVMMFWRGEPVMRVTGAYPYEQLKAEIEKGLPAAGP